ncbi:MAG TPA: hypothetical protein VIK59_02435 [Verrucomicrobiae bacterium]
MKPKSILLITAFLAFALTAFAAEKMILDIEIRSPKSVGFDTNTDLEFVTDKTAKGDFLSQIKQQDDDKYRYFQQSYPLSAKERRRAIIIYTHSSPKNQPQQVFLLPIPAKAKSADWTNWRYANYLEANAVSNFILNFDYMPPDRSTNIPPNSFELRYKIE